MSPSHEVYEPLCTSHLKPPHPFIRAWVGHSLFMQVKVSEVPGSWGQKWVLFNTCYSLCETIVGSHEINRLIFKRPANNPVGDAKTVTSSEFPAYRGTKMKCIWGESPRHPPPRPGGGCGGFKWLVHYQTIILKRVCWLKGTPYDCYTKWLESSSAAGYLVGYLP